MILWFSEHGGDRSTAGLDDHRGLKSLKVQNQMRIFNFRLYISCSLNVINAEQNKKLNPKKLNSCFCPMNVWVMTAYAENKPNCFLGNIKT